MNKKTPLPPRAISVTEFVQHLSTFTKQHRVLLVGFCAVISAIAFGGFAAGKWARDMNTPTAEDIRTLSHKLDTLAVDLRQLSDSAQADFERQSYFRATLSEILLRKSAIDSRDAQRLVTGVTVIELRDADVQSDSKFYSDFAARLRPKYRATVRGGPRNSTERGILLSSELDEEILCDFIRVASENHLDLKFVQRIPVGDFQGPDRYQVFINAEADIARGALRPENIRTIRERCPARSTP